MPQPIAIAYHLIWTVYGSWLPNDPRGSGSRVIRNDVLGELGELHHGRKKAQPAGAIIRGFQQRAAEALRHPLLTFNEPAVKEVAEAFAIVADAAARPLLAPLTYERFPRLRVVRADSAYGRYGLPAWVATLDHFLLRLVQRPLKAVGFVLLPGRWVVERTFAWLGRYRRPSRDYEREAIWQECEARKLPARLRRNDPSPPAPRP